MELPYFVLHFMPPCYDPRSLHPNQDINAEGIDDLEACGVSEECLVSGLVCFVGERILPAAGSRDCRSRRSLPPGTTICTVLSPPIASTATGYKASITSSEACILTTAESNLDLPDRLLAANSGVAHLFTVGALDSRPVLGSSALFCARWRVESVRLVWKRLG